MMIDINKFHSGVIACPERSTQNVLGVVRNYLPSNYHAIPTVNGDIAIFGEDVAGWTFDDYVVPRLASGLHTVRKDT
jgi:hypothetical protein